MLSNLFSCKFIVSTSPLPAFPRFISLYSLPLHFYQLSLSSSHYICAVLAPVHSGRTALSSTAPPSLEITADAFTLRLFPTAADPSSKSSKKQPMRTWVASTSALEQKSLSLQRSHRLHMAETRQLTGSDHFQGAGMWSAKLYPNSQQSTDRTFSTARDSIRTESTG